MIIIANLKKSIRVKASRSLVINGKHLLASWGKEKERKNTSEGKRKEKKFVRLQPPETRTLALHAFSAFQYSTPTHLANLTHRSAKRVCV